VCDRYYFLLVKLIKFFFSILTYIKLYYTIRYPGPADNNELKIEKITDVQFIQNQCKKAIKTNQSNVCI